MSGLLSAAASLTAEHGLSVVTAHGLGSCSVRALGQVGLAALQHVESPQTTDRTCGPCTSWWILIHCTIREVMNLNRMRKGRNWYIK